MKENQQENVVSAQTAMAKATEKAKEALLAKGIHYPCYDHNLSPEANYDALMAYSAHESALIVQFLKMPSGHRPIETFSEQPQKNFNTWGRPYYD